MGGRKKKKIVGIPGIAPTIAFVNLCISSVFSGVVCLSLKRTVVRQTSVTFITRQNSRACSSGILTNVVDCHFECLFDYE